MSNKNNKNNEKQSFIPFLCFALTLRVSPRKGIRLFFIIFVIYMVCVRMYHMI